jgi:hypothetical protein
MTGQVFRFSVIINIWNALISLCLFLFLPLYIIQMYTCRSLKYNAFIPQHNMNTFFFFTRVKKNICTKVFYRWKCILSLFEHRLIKAFQILIMTEKRKTWPVIHYNLWMNLQCKHENSYEFPNRLGSCCSHHGGGYDFNMYIS